MDQEGLGSVEINDRRWPIVVLIFEGVPSEEAFDSYLRELDRIYARGQRHVTIVDARKGGLIPRSMRRRQGEWLKENREVIERYSIGTVTVLGSPVLRFVLATIYLIQPPVVPNVIVSTWEEGLSWALAQLQKEGLRPPVIDR